MIILNFKNILFKTLGLYKKKFDICILQIYR